VQEAYNKQQPVLLGTVSIEKSELISKLLTKHKLPHQVLNAKYHAKEAEIIAKAGIPGAITIATNMAGRGTDIMLGGNPAVETKGISDEQQIAKILTKIEQDKQTVINAGGLFVLGTERHESRRIDDQLRGRSGRQGDPGISKFFVALDDELIRIFYSEKITGFLSGLSIAEDEPVAHSLISKSLKTAQKKIESHNYEIRKNLLKFDDVINFQRKNIYQLRQKIIACDNVLPQIFQYSNQIIIDLCEDAMPKNSYQEQWSLDSLDNEIFKIYGLKLNLLELATNSDKQSIIQAITDAVKSIFDSKIALAGSDIFTKVAKQIFLHTIDLEWKDHLLSLDKLRNGINLRAYAQKDPIMEYKKEAFILYEDMILRAEELIVSQLSRINIDISTQADFTNRTDAKFVQSEAKNNNKKSKK
jgi:preprotein translocase subunit SecA